MLPVPNFLRNKSFVAEASSHMTYKSKSILSSVQQQIQPQLQSIPNYVNLNNFATSSVPQTIATTATPSLGFTPLYTSIPIPITTLTPQQSFANVSNQNQVFTSNQAQQIPSPQFFYQTSQ